MARRVFGDDGREWTMFERADLHPSVVAAVEAFQRELAAKSVSLDMELVEAFRREFLARGLSLSTAPEPEPDRRLRVVAPAGVAREDLVDEVVWPPGGVDLSRYAVVPDGTRVEWSPLAADVPAPAVSPSERAAIVAATLRQVAGFGDGEVAWFRRLADEVEGVSLTLGVRCPMCFDAVCDDDCVLAPLRSPHV